jgi:hypothetical protein
MCQGICAGLAMLSTENFQICTDPRFFLYPSLAVMKQLQPPNLMDDMPLNYWNITSQITICVHAYVWHITIQVIISTQVQIVQWSLSSYHVQYLQLQLDNSNHRVSQPILHNFIATQQNVCCTSTQDAKPKQCQYKMLSSIRKLCWHRPAIKTTKDVKFPSYIKPKQSQYSANTTTPPESSMRRDKRGTWHPPKPTKSKTKDTAANQIDLAAMATA